MILINLRIYICHGSLMVSVLVFNSVEPGSIPGCGKFFWTKLVQFVSKNKPFVKYDVGNCSIMVRMPGFEAGSPMFDS